MTLFQASDPENRDKVLSNLYSSTKGAKNLSLKLKLVTESEYTGIKAHSNKKLSWCWQPARRV